MQQTRVLSLLVTAFSVILCLATPVLAVAEEYDAQRYFNRGMAAVEMANTPEDYGLAIEEFKKASELAPDWPEVYFNLGLIQEKAGQYRDAAISLRRYLQLEPDSPDAGTIRTLADKTEFKAEQVITEEDILNIFASLGDSSQWQLKGITPDDIVTTEGRRGMHIGGRTGDVINIWFLEDANQYNGIDAKPVGKTLSFDTMYYLCPASVSRDRCPDISQWHLEIISKRLIKMSRKRFLSEIKPYIRAEIQTNSYEFVRK